MKTKLTHTTRKGKSILLFSPYFELFLTIDILPYKLIIMLYAMSCWRCPEILGYLWSDELHCLYARHPWRYTLTLSSNVITKFLLWVFSSSNFMFFLLSPSEFCSRRFVVNFSSQYDFYWLFWLAFKPQNLWTDPFLKRLTSLYET